MSGIIDSLKGGLKKWEPWGNLVTGLLVISVNSLVVYTPVALACLLIFMPMYLVKLIETKVFQRERPYFTKFILNNFFGSSILVLSAILRTCSLLAFIPLKIIGYIVGVVPLLISAIRGYDITSSESWLHVIRAGRNRDYELSSVRDLWATYLDFINLFNEAFYRTLDTTLTWTRFAQYARNFHHTVDLGRRSLRRAEEREVQERNFPPIQLNWNALDFDDGQVNDMQFGRDEQPIKLSLLAKNSKAAVENIALKMMTNDGDAKACCTCLEKVKKDNEAVIIVHRPENDIEPGVEVPYGYVKDMLHLGDCWESFRGCEMRNRVPSTREALADQAILLYCHVGDQSNESQNNEYAFYAIEDPDFHKSDNFREALRQRDLDGELIEVPQNEAESEVSALSSECREDEEAQQLQLASEVDSNVSSVRQPLTVSYPASPSAPSISGDQPAIVPANEVGNHRRRSIA